ncbi:MAG: monovalent cation/H(+) antiporter subunit G [Synergistetes bacterium]|nr:monovalent cation/H(+) antiporter subunit G [Synergistota bacterium]
MGAIIWIAAIIGVTFNALGSVALLRFPDVYTRLHGATKATTFGSIFTTLAVIVYGFVRWYYDGNPKYVILAVHAIVAVVFVLITNPVSAHAIARAAHRSEIMPVRAVVDELFNDNLAKKRGGTK